MKRPDFETHVTIVLSTAHIPQWVAEAMDKGNGVEYLSYEKLTYGYRVFVGTQPDPDVVPHELLPAMWAAWGYGAKWLEFDCDGDMMEELPTWEW